MDLFFDLFADFKFIAEGFPGILRSHSFSTDSKVEESNES